MQGGGQKWGSSDGLQRAESFARSLCDRVFPRRGQLTTTSLARGRQSALRDRNFLTGSQRLSFQDALRVKAREDCPGSS